MCWFRHDWMILDVKMTEVYYDNEDPYPNHRKTSILYICKKCGKLKTKTLDGNFLQSLTILKNIKMESK